MINPYMVYLATFTINNMNLMKVNIPYSDPIRLYIQYNFPTNILLNQERWLIPKNRSDEHWPAKLTHYMLTPCLSRDSAMSQR